LPFANGTFPAVLTLWISTDVDDFAAVLAEAARVLTPGGVAGLLRRPSLLQRAARPVDGRRRGPRAPHLSSSGMASAGRRVGQRGRLGPGQRHRRSPG